MEDPFCKQLYSSYLLDVSRQNDVGCAQDYKCTIIVAGKGLNRPFRVSQKYLYVLGLFFILIKTFEDFFETIDNVLDARFKSILKALNSSLRYVLTTPLLELRFLEALAHNFQIIRNIEIIN